ncbi:MAG TPA: sulfite exporter TauE/SafE family protein [Candidatus Avacidaminococcus intestinavium]|uniref:Sulfite exporter TauE/SafE family protein n=1 Tax=Candidatus Avacidaminococcus intestinavium TaxID=2840684 RepID=A0A9D1MPQ4_9FIRM|nr:sulfite exporter TauE/SafE family protein [Candidatus Avacidaminococcus intestinavium]
MLEDLLFNLSQMLNDSLWLAPPIAFLAGVLTSLTPCAFTSVPLVIGYVGSGSKSTRKSFLLSLLFAIGMAITFTLLGVLAAVFGSFFTGAGQWWYLALGTLMVLMALQTFELFEFIPSSYLTGKSKMRGYPGALATGILAGIFSSPCATPVLVVLLSVVAGSGNLWWGAFLLACYAVGHSVLVIAAGTSIGFARSITANPRYGTFSIILKYVLGTLMLLIAFYMFYLGF